MEIPDKPSSAPRKKVDRTFVIVSAVMALSFIGLVYSVGLPYFGNRIQKSKTAASGSATTSEARRLAPNPKAQPAPGNSPPKASSGETLVRAASNCQALGINGEFCRKVWAKVESDTGEIFWVDTGRNMGTTVFVFHGLPGVPAYQLGAPSEMAFDCEGHYEEGMGGDLMDAPPRSVAGEIAKVVCAKCDPRTMVCGAPSPAPAPASTLQQSPAGGPGEGGGVGTRGSGSAGSGTGGYPIAGEAGYSEPACLFCPNPQFSNEAVKAKNQGTVLLRFIVTASGTTKNIQVIHSLGLDLDQKAIAAVRTWKFKPAIGPNRKPAAVIVQAEISFRLL